MATLARDDLLRSILCRSCGGRLAYRHFSNCDRISIPIKLAFGFARRELLLDELFAVMVLSLRIGECVVGCWLTFRMYDGLIRHKPVQDLSVSPSAIEFSRKRDAVHRLKPLLDAAAENGELAKKWSHTPVAEIPDSIPSEIQSNASRILREGQLIDVAALDEVYPQLGSMFSTKMIGFLAIHERLREKAEHGKVSVAKALEAEWDDWVNPRLTEINAAMRRFY